MRLAGTILGLSLLSGAGLAQAAVPQGNQLTAAETTVCSSVKHCVDILERHAPEEYDYTVLYGEFLRFGLKGKAALFEILSGEDAEKIARAQNLLLRPGFRFTPDEQRAIAGFWPRGDLDTHAALMRQLLSPLMRARAIETLNHDDAAVRGLSREIIADTVQAKMDFPLRPEDFGRLARAVIEEPSSALVKLLSRYEMKKTQPVFSRLLKSGHREATQLAYQKLYADNPKIAFENLIETLYALQDSDKDVALALAAMLRKRDKTRKDGFYLKFAKSLSEDPEMSAMGRFVGFDAVMASPESPSLIAISDTLFSRASLKQALNIYEGFPEIYTENLKPLIIEAPEPWLNILQAGLDDPFDLRLIELAGVTPSKYGKALAAKSLAHTPNYQVMMQGAALTAAQGDKGAISRLTTLRESHPISDMRFAARQSLRRLKGQTAPRIMPDVLKGDLKTMNQSARYCAVNAADFGEMVSRMPYFGAQSLETEPHSVNRGDVTTAFPTQSGWLVGYDKGEWGGALIYYDGLTGERLVMSAPDYFRQSDRNIKAVIPVTVPKLGEFANEFWVITGRAHMTSSRAAIYHVTFDGKNFSSNLHMRLPSAPRQIEQREDNNIIFGFHYPEGAGLDGGTVPDPTLFNPPLMLSPDGNLTRACEATLAGGYTAKKASPS